MKPAQLFFRTQDNIGLLVARLALAIALFPHGAQKVLGWWGGSGFKGTLAAFAEHMNVPPALTIMAMAAEFLAPLALVIGFLTRLSAFGIAVTMFVAVSMHAANGFFAGDKGFEYPLTLGLIAVALILAGGGKWSVDRCIAEKC